MHDLPELRSRDLLGPNYLRGPLAVFCCIRLHRTFTHRIAAPLKSYTAIQRYGFTALCTMHYTAIQRYTQYTTYACMQHTSESSCASLARSTPQPKLKEALWRQVTPLVLRYGAAAVLAVHHLSTLPSVSSVSLWERQRVALGVTQPASVLLLSVAGSRLCIVTLLRPVTVRHRAARYGQ